VGSEEGGGKTLHSCVNVLMQTEQDIEKFLCVIRMLGLIPPNLSLDLRRLCVLDLVELDPCNTGNVVADNV
jgi:hypothetical protein